MLYHGTLLYDFDLDALAAVLAFAPRQPEYRAARSHRDFVANLPVKRDALSAALAEAFDAREPLAPVELAKLLAVAQALAAEKYGDRAWTERVP